MSQNYENRQGMEVLHKKQRMEMAQNELKIVLECNFLENGELERDTNRIQWSRCLKLIPQLTACVLESLVRVLLWVQYFLSCILHNSTYVDITKFWQLPISFMISKFDYK